MSTAVVTRKNAPAAKNTKVGVTQAVTPTSEIISNLTIGEFKADLGITEVQVVEGPNGRFMSSKGKSIGTVGKNTDLSQPLQVIVLQTDEGDVFILCNQGTGGDYNTVATL